MKRRSWGWGGLVERLAIAFLTSVAVADSLHSPNLRNH
jgi:hypothetical protein